MEISANILKQIGAANPTDEIVENKTYNTVDKTEIVTTVAYLMELNKESLYERYGVENHEIIKKLEADERELCSKQRFGIR